MIDIRIDEGPWKGWRLTIDATSGYPMMIGPGSKTHVPSAIENAEYVSQKDVAEILGWSKQQVSNYYKEGRLPSPDLFVSGRPAWRRDRIEAYRGTHD